MNAEIITVGTEILLGDILNTNARHLARELAACGVSVRRQTTVGDNTARLLAALDAAFAESDLVILTGGLGPTEDDLTKETVFQWFELESVIHQESKDLLLAFFESRQRAMPESNLKQTLFPVDAQVLRNDFGTAPGCIVEGDCLSRIVPGREGKTAIVLPGPPREMVPMFDSGVKPWITRHIRGIIQSRTIHFYGIGESAMEAAVKDLIHQENPSLAPYAKTGECELRITARAETVHEAKALIAPLEAEVIRRLGEFVYGHDEDTLARVTARLLLEKKQTLSLAESCTGGLVASRLVDIPGSSAFLLEGLVAYSNQAKIRRLGVEREILEEFGAVSHECAAAMAVGSRAETGADWAISVSGIAGPDGGSEEKPVGMVCFGIAGPHGVRTMERRFRGDRQAIRERAALEALDLLRRSIRGEQ